jgi:hypothetical protein
MQILPLIQIIYQKSDNTIFADLKAEFVHRFLSLLSDSHQ